MPSSPCLVAQWSARSTRPRWPICRAAALSAGLVSASSWWRAPKAATPECASVEGARPPRPGKSVACFDASPAQSSRRRRRNPGEKATLPEPEPLFRGSSYGRPCRSRSVFSLSPMTTSSPCRPAGLRSPTPRPRDMPGTHRDPAPHRVPTSCPPERVCGSTACADWHGAPAREDAGHDLGDAARWRRHCPARGRRGARRRDQTRAGQTAPARPASRRAPDADAFSLRSLIAGKLT